MVFFEKSDDSEHDAKEEKDVVKKTREVAVKNEIKDKELIVKLQSREVDTLLLKLMLNRFTMQSSISKDQG
jgi:hypothetical protein